MYIKRERGRQSRNLETMNILSGKRHMKSLYFDVFLAFKTPSG